MNWVELTALFKETRLDYSEPAFYDSPSFIKVEKDNPEFLEYYAQFVKNKDHSSEYLKRAEKEIRIISNILYNELVKEGRYGACVDYSWLLSRILEKRGIWNYMSKGSLSIEFPPSSEIKPKFFWSISTGSFVCGHSWIVAPPFKVIDLTINQQPYIEKEKDFLPDFICTKEGNECEASDEDLISYDLRDELFRTEGIRTDQIKWFLPRFAEFSQEFTPIEFQEQNISFKYITVGITAPDTSLEKSTIIFNGKTGIEMYNEVINPVLQSHGIFLTIKELALILIPYRNYM